MLRIIAKAKMHPVERYVAALGVAVMSIGAGAAAALGPRFAIWVITLGLVAGVLLAAVPGARLSYLLGDRALYAGRIRLDFRAIIDARVVRLGGTFLLGGLTLPGYWAGWAWSHRLGRFRMLGSTGLGQGVLITTSDGRRFVLTPANPVDLVVRLQMYAGGSSHTISDLPPEHGGLPVL